MRGRSRCRWGACGKGRGKRACWKASAVIHALPRHLSTSSPPFPLWPLCLLLCHQQTALYSQTFSLNVLPLTCLHRNLVVVFLPLHMHLKMGSETFVSPSTILDVFPSLLENPCSLKFTSPGYITMSPPSGSLHLPSLAFEA